MVTLNAKSAKGQPVKADNHMLINLSIICTFVET